MCEPKQNDIDEKAQELFFAKLSKLDAFKQPLIGEAIGNDDGALIEVLLEFALATTNDDKLACHDKFIAALKDYFDESKLEAEARDCLIAEVGYYKQTDVDDFKFVQHDTR